MDGDETASKHSPESIFSFIDNVEDSKQKKYKKSGFEEYEGAWEGRVEPLLSCMNEMEHLYRMSGEVALNDLKGKRYLLFVCLYFHSQFNIEFEFEFYYPQDFIPACHDLCSYRDDFEIVLVSLNKNYPDCPKLFTYPFRHFPASSVVVPFDDYHRRSSICQLLDPVDSGFGFDFKCLFLDVSHKTMLVGEPNSMPLLVAHLKELVRNSSFDALRSYQRLLKNMWPVNSCLPPVRCPIARIFEHVKPEYSHDINAMVSQLSPIQIGQSLDVKMLLSAGSNELGYLVRKDGQQVELGKAIQDKYLMICCFHAPVFRVDWDSMMVQSLLNTYLELYALGVDFEMVVVVKMKKLADYKQVFDHFLSAFPPSCFVIPFEDLKRRDFICNYLQLDYLQCLILDKKGTDMKKNILLHGNRFVRDYGADAFPFTDEKLQELQADEEPRWKTCSTNNLVGLLKCKLSDILKKTNAEDGCGTVTTISDLNNKDFVGLFLCVEGNLIPKLKEVYQHCKTHHKSFEILLVYMPMRDSLDPQNYKLYVDNLLLKHNLSLWYMPFDNSVSHKLFRLVSPLGDELIILGTQDASIDPYGGDVLSTFGINAYPFTRKELVQREVNKFKELTLETLLVYKSQSYLLKGNTDIPVEDLKGKNVLLWMSSLSLDNISFYHKLLSWYENNRTKNPDFEVVFVRKHNSAVSDDDLELSEVMPWLVCPFIADHSASIEKKLFPDGGIGYDALVEFGTDGLVCSFTADEDLLDIGVDESGKIPFGRSNLRRSAIENLRRYYFTLMNNYTD